MSHSVGNCKYIGANEVVKLMFAFVWSDKKISFNSF